ncbi:MAG: ATP synthase F0 subunit C [Oscillospiraceae bacterium]|nr:ATP synthase F0 subunit C [Oscillospiraceae bacterium]
MSAKQLSKKIPALLLALLFVLALSAPVFAAPVPDRTPDAAQTQTTESAEAEETSAKGIASAIAIGLAAAGGALAMGIAVGKSAEAIARQPEADGKIRTTLMLGLVFIETAIIYALLVVILIIFVL